MTREEKQTELEKHRVIVSATLDYLLEHFTGSIVYDDFDPIKDYYEQQKIQAGKYFKQRRLDRLEAQLSRLTEGFKHEINQKFEQYIRESTGFEIEIFKEERKHIEEVLAKQKIETEKESLAVGLSLRTNQLVSQDEENILELLLQSYYERSKELDKLSSKKKKVNSEIINTVEGNGIVTETIEISFGPKPPHFVEREAFSPDGKRRITITEWSDINYPSTYVTIFFEQASGPIYGANGICPDVNAFWKDNNTIVIETKKSYVNGLQHRKVQSFDDIVFVEYIET